jgi:hypothetical protein
MKVHTTAGGFFEVTREKEGWMVGDGDNVVLMHHSRDEAVALADRFDALLEAGDEEGFWAAVDAAREPLREEGLM